MSKLIDTDKLARLSKALDSRAKAMVEAERARAVAAEEAIQANVDLNKAAIEAINHAETGILATAKKYADDKDAELKEQLDGVDEGLSNRLDGIDAEQDVQDGRIKANEDAIGVLNGNEEQEGSVAKKIKDAVDPVIERMDDAEGRLDGIDGEQDVQDGRILANEQAIGVINGDENQEGSMAKKIKDAVDPVIERMDDAEGRLDDIDAEQDVQDGRILANEQAIGVLNGGVDQEGSVDKKIKDAIDQVNQAAGELEDRVDVIEGRLDDLDAEQDVQDVAIKAAQDAADQAQREVDAVEERMLVAEGRLDDIDDEQDAQDAAIEAAQAAADQAQREVDAVEGRMDAAEQAIGVLNGGEDQEGSVAKAVKDAVDPVQADLDELEAVVGGPAEGENPATGLHKIVADGDAKALQDAKTYTDEQITALVDSAPEAMNTLRELAEEIEAHQDVYDAYVAEVSAALDKKVDKIENHRLVSETEIAAWNAKAEVADVEQALEDAKDYTDAEIAKVNGDADLLEGRVEVLEGYVGHDVDGENPATGLFLEVDQARAAADQAQNEVDACEGRLDAIEAEQDVQDRKIKANEDAIGVLNGGEDQEGSVAKSIADALEEYSTTEEMKTMLGNVVQSLALTMENDKVVLKLGGVDGIAITEVSLDMATDADIDAIVNGLDAE